MPTELQQLIQILDKKYSISNSIDNVDTVAQSYNDFMQKLSYADEVALVQAYNNSSDTSGYLVRKEGQATYECLKQGDAYRVLTSPDEKRHAKNIAFRVAFLLSLACGSISAYGIFEGNVSHVFGIFVPMPLLAIVFGIAGFTANFFLQRNSAGPLITKWRALGFWRGLFGGITGSPGWRRTKIAMISVGTVLSSFFLGLVTYFSLRDVFWGVGNYVLADALAAVIAVLGSVGLLFMFSNMLITFTERRQKEGVGQTFWATFSRKDEESNTHFGIRMAAMTLGLALGLFAGVVSAIGLTGVMYGDWIRQLANWGVQGLSAQIPGIVLCIVVVGLVRMLFNTRSVSRLLSDFSNWLADFCTSVPRPNSAPVMTWGNIVCFLMIVLNAVGMALLLGTNMHALTWLSQGLGLGISATTLLIIAQLSAAAASTSVNTYGLVMADSAPAPPYVTPMIDPASQTESNTSGSVSTRSSVSSLAEEGGNGQEARNNVIGGQTGVRGRDRIEGNPVDPRIAGGKGRVSLEPSAYRTQRSVSL